jgi:Domain of unknown function (DUF4395)
MDAGSSGSVPKRNFILQQGFRDPAAATCATQYSGLQFQPRVVALLVLVAVILAEPLIFLALGAILWWSALFPKWNPFEALYNRVLAVRSDRVPLPPAPPPRRFSQGMAGTFMLAIGISLLMGWRMTAIVLEVLLMLALGALVFGFCLGSFLFHLLSGRLAFARRTLPWARGA